MVRTLLACYRNGVLAYDYSSMHEFDVLACQAGLEVIM